MILESSLASALVVILCCCAAACVCRRTNDADIVPDGIERTSSDEEARIQQERRREKEIEKDRIRKASELRDAQAAAEHAEWLERQRREEELAAAQKREEERKRADENERWELSRYR